MQENRAERVYTNHGNPGVVALVDRDARNVLDVGCGSGDTAALLRARDPNKRLYGITASSAEARAAAKHMQACWVADLDGEVPMETAELQYDVLIFSHVLEHLRDPQLVLKRLVRLLRPGGTCVIAVPNVMVWRQRWLFLLGRFEYQEHGIMDETHLRFFSFETAARYLLAQTPELLVIEQRVTASVPLWVLRRRVLSPAVAGRIDALGGKLWPNLFGGEVLLKCKKQS
jgi:2-polyprenyl-3-methyl-5-hydroxy-6-metoxy-1,4-benzoquinol methylase